MTYIIYIMEPKNPNTTQISTMTINLTSALTSTSTNLRIETTGYPKGFKFILLKPFQGAQNDVKPWLFNMEEYFDNTSLSINKWIRIAVSNMNGNATLWW